MARWLVIIACTLTVVPAHADDDPEDLDASYLWDGGAVPLFWAPLAGGALLQPLLPPRDRPFGFSVTEGGAIKSTWQVPGWALAGLGVTAVSGMVASGDRARYYHAKGLAQSMATTMFVTGLLKYTFSRRRPYWTEGDRTINARRSFPSGHASQAFAIATYTTLYLDDHVELSTGWRTLAYAGIGLAASGFATERVLNRRHHASDVIVGGLLGAATALAIYGYQQQRFDRATHSTGTSTPTLAVAFTW